MMACTLTLDSLGSVMAVSITESLWLGPSSGGGGGKCYMKPINIA